jgi:flagellin FlaB
LKSNQSSKTNDQVAAIGIGAMIVFIALILVAAVAAAVIIQTAEKLQQNAQTAGDDTADNMAGKLFIDTAFVDTPAANAGDNYLLFVKLAPGSEITNIASISFQMFCDNGNVEGDSLTATGGVAEMTYTEMDGSALVGGDLMPGTAYRLVIDASGGDDCSADAVLVDDGKAELYLHVANGGSTYETFNVDDDTEGAIVV